MRPKQKPCSSTRPPRIRVPNNERALFTVDSQKFVGVVQRLSVTGGSAILSKGPIAHGTFGEMALTTVFGKVTAHIEFLQTGADGVPLAQAFRFLAMDEVSRKRFTSAAKQMEEAGFSDAKDTAQGGLASESLSKLWGSVRTLSAHLAPSRRS